MDSLKIGDIVVYPMHGAGKIAGVEKNEINGQEKSYYVLDMPLGNLKVMLPLDSLDKLGLREVIDRSEIGSLENTLQGKPESQVGGWNKRYHAILARMKEGDLNDIAAVVRNLELQDRKKKISTGERRLLELARQILISELMYAKDQTEVEVVDWIEEILNRPRIDT